MTRCSWWLEAARSADALVPGGLTGINGDDWSLSPRIHCLDHMRRVLDAPGVMRLAVVPCGRCARCCVAAAHGVGLGPRATALIAMQGVVWFPDPRRETPPGWGAARITADSFVVQSQRARIDLVLSLMRPERPESKVDRRELLRRVAVLRARQESAWSSAASAAQRALRWVCRYQGAAGAGTLEVAWRGFLASSVECGGVVYDTPLHVRDALSVWRAN